MNPPLKSNAPPLDSDTELNWPPPDDARFATSVLDIEARRVITLDEAAQELDAAATDRPSLRPAAQNNRLAVRADMSPPGPNAGRQTSRSVLARLWPVPMRQISRRSLTIPLTLIVIVQAIVLVAVLVRGRATPDPVQPARSEPAVAVTAAAPRPAVVPAQATIPAAPGSASEASAVDSKAYEPAAAVAAEGHLLVRSEPAGASVAIDGRRRGTTPLVVDGLAAGAHRVQISTAAGASVEQVVTIEAGSTTTVVVPMNAAAATAGWVSVAVPIALEVFEDGQLLGTAADGPLRLAAGVHHLEFANEPLAYRGQEVVTIRGGEVVRVRPSIPDGVLHVNAQPWANVWVDGEPVGETPLANLKVALGRHEIRFRHPSLGEQVRQVVVSAREPARVSVSMKP